MNEYNYQQAHEYFPFLYTESEIGDTGAYKIEVTNESGSATCGFKMDVLGKFSSTLVSYHFLKQRISAINDN